MKNRVYGQVWGALDPTIEAIPVADYVFYVSLDPKLYVPD